MAVTPPTSPAETPGARHRAGRRPHVHWELLACGWNGHHLVGTDAAVVRAEDQAVARELGGHRWHRCLRCDTWMYLTPPEPPVRDHVPERHEIAVPLRGRPLRDRYVLRLIAADRGVHVLVLSALTVAIFLFASDRQTLRGDYTRILNALQGGLGGPVNQSRKGLLGELNHLFTISSRELYLIGAALAVYTFVLAIEAVGLWMARRWAEYLTFVETAVLIPVEVYELTSRLSALKILTLVINLAVVVYLALAKRLFGLRGGGAAAREEQLRDSGWPAIDAATPPLAQPAT